jgi:hypothetical protein
MAHWKRLTGTDGDHIEVNMDVVAYLHGFKITRPFVLLAAEMLKARR